MLRRRALTAAALVAAVVLTACDPFASPGGGAGGPVALGQIHPARTFVDPAYDEDILGTIRLLNQYWTADFGQLGGNYQALPEANVTIYYPGDVPGLPAACGVDPQMGANNAFHCGGYVSWDETLMRSLYTEIGDWAPSMVIAHEWGHYVQALLGVEGSYSIQDELQADCYAGAFMRYSAYEAGILEPGDVQEGILNFKGIARERPTDPWMAPLAHGTPEERAVAVSLGFGAFEPTVCAEYAAFERTQPLALGGGFTLTLPIASTGQIESDGHASISFAGRGSQTFGSVWYLPGGSIADVQAVLEATIGGGAVALHTTTSTYLDAEGVAILYEQADNGGYLHGVFSVMASPAYAGVVAIDVVEGGAAPAEFTDAGWQRVSGYTLLTISGIGPPEL